MPVPERCGGDQRGMALAVSVFALAVMGGLVACNFVAGWIEQQSGRNALYGMQASEAAEAELRQSLLLLPAGTLSELPLGGAAHSLGAVSAPGMTVQREVARLTLDLFLIRARASRVDADGDALATRSLGLLVKLADSAGSAMVLPLTQRPWVQLY